MGNDDDGPTQPAGEGEEAAGSSSSSSRSNTFEIAAEATTSSIFDVAAIARLKRQQQSSGSTSNAAVTAGSSSIFDVATIARLKRQQQRGMGNQLLDAPQDDAPLSLTKRGATTGAGWRMARARMRQSRQWHRPVLKNHAPGWWQVPPRTASAADAFDVRLSSRSVRGERLLSRMQLDKPSVPTTRLPSARASDAFDEALFSITSNRFVEPYVAQKERFIRPPPRAGAVGPVTKPWDLNDSLWKRRCAWCDGHDFLDSRKIKNAKMSKIFRGSLDAGLAKYIMKHDDGDSDDDDDKSHRWMDSSEVGDVGAEFGENLDTFFGIFDVYAALDGDNSECHGFQPGPHAPRITQAFAHFEYAPA